MTPSTNEVLRIHRVRQLFEVRSIQERTEIAVTAIPSRYYPQEQPRCNANPFTSTRWVLNLAQLYVLRPFFAPRRILRIAETLAFLNKLRPGVSRLCEGGGCAEQFDGIRPIPGGHNRLRISLLSAALRRTMPDFLPKHTFGIIRSREKLQVLQWIMSLAYRIVFECPKGHNINLQKKCANVSLSETEAMKLFGDENLSCPYANCGWRGKASMLKLRRILPFNWILAPVS